MAPESQLVTRTADQMMTFNSLVAAAVTLIVGVLIYNIVLVASLVLLQIGGLSGSRGNGGNGGNGGM